MIRQAGMEWGDDDRKKVGGPGTTDRDAIGKLCSSGIVGNSPETSCFHSSSKSVAHSSQS